MSKILKNDPTPKIGAVFNQRFNRIKRQFSLNLANVFNTTYDRAVQIGIDLGGKKAAKAAKANIKQKINAVSRMMSKDIDNIKNEQSQNVARTIAQSYAQGLPSLKLKQTVQKQVGQSNYKIDRAIRTNTAYLSSLTKIMTWYDMGFRAYEWVLGKDDKSTRPYHKWLHGRKFKIKDALEGRAPIPGRIPNKDGSVNLGESIHCRCGIRLPRN